MLVLYFIIILNIVFLFYGTLSFYYFNWLILFSSLMIISRCYQNYFFRHYYNLNLYSQKSKWIWTIIINYYYFNKLCCYIKKKKKLTQISWYPIFKRTSYFSYFKSNREFWLLNQ